MEKKTVFACYALAFLFGIAIWQTGECAQSSAKETGPSRNLSPRHVVRISGRLPKHLNIRLVADYETTADGESCWMNTNEWWGGNRRLIRDVIEIRRNGDRYEASLIVDKYEPGECGWQYLASNVAVTKSDNPDDIGITDTDMIDGTRYRIEDSVPRCRPYARKCSEERVWRLSNAKDIPALVRCQTLPPGETSWGGPYGANFTCQDPLNDSYKKEHLLRPSTSSVQIYFYDLNKDSDPLSTSMQGR